MCPPHSNREQIHSSENRDGQFLSSGSLRPGICPPLGLWLAHQHTATKDVGAIRKLKPPPLGYNADGAGGGNWVNGLQGVGKAK